MSGEEQVTSPDQHKPTISRKLARFGAIVTILALLAMLYGNHRGNVENIFLIGIAGLLAADAGARLRPAPGRSPLLVAARARLKIRDPARAPRARDWHVARRDHVDHDVSRAKTPRS